VYTLQVYESVRTVRAQVTGKIAEAVKLYYGPNHTQGASPFPADLPEGQLVDGTAAEKYLGGRVSSVTI
jgi:hypothetical protein